mgnify:CR=1 FL=1
MEILLVKQLNGSFKPAFDSDYENAKKFKLNEVVKCKITKPRNIKFHKKFFALVNLVFNNQEKINNIDYFREELTIEAGFFEEYTGFNGERKKQAKSISFASMDEFEFNELYSKFIEVSIKVLGCKKEDIIDNIAEHF